jgi:hypothetical protein
LQPNKSGLTFHHLGLAARDVGAATTYLTGLGYRAGPRVFDHVENVKLGMLTHDEMSDVEAISPAEGAVPPHELLSTHKDRAVRPLPPQERSP